MSLLALPAQYERGYGETITSAAALSPLDRFTMRARADATSTHNPDDQFLAGLSDGWTTTLLRPSLTEAAR